MSKLWNSITPMKKGTNAQSKGFSENGYSLKMRMSDRSGFILSLRDKSSVKKNNLA